MTPLVSILIPAYNVEAFLPQCLDSIVNQTYQNLQVIVVDDGSTDNTLNVAADYSKRYPFVEAVNQKNGGVSSARNRLLALSKGDYVIFVDSDDWIDAETVERMLNAIESTGSEIAVCGFYKEENGNTYPSPVTEKQFLIEGKKNVVKSLMEHSYMSGSLCNKLVPRKYYEGLNFRKDIWYGEDCLFLWQALNRGVEKVCFMPDCFYHYRMNDASISHTSFNYKKMSGHEVWKEICNGAEAKWQDIAYIAKGTYVQQDIMLLYFAAKASYESDVKLDEIRQNVKQNMHYMKQAGISNPKRLLLGYSLSYAYSLSSVLVRAFL